MQVMTIDCLRTEQQVARKPRAANLLVTRLIHERKADLIESFAHQ